MVRRISLSGLAATLSGFSVPTYTIFPRVSSIDRLGKLVSLPLGCLPSTSAARSCRLLSAESTATGCHGIAKTTALNG